MKHRGLQRNLQPFILTIITFKKYKFERYKTYGHVGAGQKKTMSSRTCAYGTYRHKIESKADRDAEPDTLAGA